MMHPINATKTEAFIACNLDHQLALLFAKDYVQGVITARSEQIVPIPNMSTCIIGLLQHRDKNYWLVDLSVMLGNSSLSTEKDFHQVILTTHEKQCLGLIVNQVEGIQYLDHEEIYPTILPNTSPLLKPYLKGYYQNDTNQDNPRVQYVLNPESILSSSILHN
jgi:positive phototaxis protein PixI